MGRTLYKIPLNTLVKTIVGILLNKFDCFTTIEGGTGIGKSTLAYRIAKGVKFEFRRLYRLDEKTVLYYYNKVKKDKGVSMKEFVDYLMKLKEEKAYNFIPKRDLIYSQGSMMKFLSSWNRIGVPDEMINITFNRDFYSQEQKDIIKMINMYRDHCNLILACVPMFVTLDNQIKNLCKIRITVVRRGVGLIQTPNKTIYGKDRWDTAVNEKIEKEWLLKNAKKPAYSRLTTARGIVRFGALREKDELKYQAIKNEKRASILKDVKSDDEEDSVVNKTIKMLREGKIKNKEVLEGLAIAEGVKPETFISKIEREMKKEGTGDHKVNAYLWEKKIKKGVDASGVF